MNSRPRHRNRNSPDMLTNADAPARANSRTGRAGQALGRAAWRNRKRLPPVGAALLLAALGESAVLAPHGLTTSIAADLALPAGVLAWRRWRATRPWKSRHTRLAHRHGFLPKAPDRPMRRAELIRMSCAAGTAACLLTAMPLMHCGPFAAPMAGFLWLGWLPGVAIPYWWRRRIRAHEDPDVLDPREATWLEKVGASGCALPGSYLKDLEDITTVQGAWKATIVLNGGRQTSENARAASTLIASAFGVPISSVAIEEDVAGTASLATLMIFPTNPLIEMPFFPGPSALDLDTGIATIGLHIDGTPTLYQMWRPKWGAVHDHISGATGSGKSGLVTSLFAMERSAGGLIVSWGGDPQFGKSFGYWCDYLDYFAPGVDEIMAMLMAADAELDRRSKAAAFATWTDADGTVMYGETDFWPTLEQPLLVITIDEWQDVWGTYPEAIDIAVRIAILGRKCGMKLRVITHLPTLESVGSSKLRQPLTAGNVIALRTSDRSAGHVINLPADPNELPKNWPGMIGPGSETTGIGFIGSVESRAAVFRGWRPEEREVATRWAKVGTTPTLSPESHENCGPAYTQWRERLAARRRGEEPLVPGVTDIDDFDEEETETSKPKRQGGKKTGTVKPAKANFEKAPASSFDHMVKTAAPATGPVRGERKRQILAFLEAEGETTTGIIADRLKIPLPTVSSTLSRAAKAGEVIDAGHGAWAALSAYAVA